MRCIIRMFVFFFQTIILKLVPCTSSAKISIIDFTSWSRELMITWQTIPKKWILGRHLKSNVNCFRNLVITADPHQFLDIFFDPRSTNEIYIVWFGRYKKRYHRYKYKPLINIYKISNISSNNGQLKMASGYLVETYF